MPLQLNEAATIYLAAGLVVAGALALGYALRKAPAVYRLLATGSTDVISLVTESNGPVNTAGWAVRHEETLTAPFTGRECLAITDEV